MRSLTADLRALFARELSALEREIELFADDASVWKTLPGVTNSVGNLALHMCGNLRHFVGHTLGGSNYVRDREREFTRASGSRAELVEEIRTTRAEVDQVLAKLDEQSLAQPFPAAPRDIRVSTALFLLHLASHLAFHLGQVGYLRRIQLGDNRNSSPMSPLELDGNL